MSDKKRITWLVLVIVLAIILATVIGIGIWHIWKRKGGDGCRSRSFHTPAATTSAPADRSLNLGAVMSIGAEPIPGLCGAYIGSWGELVVTDVSPEDYPPGLDIFPKGAYHVYDYMFFFTNLKQNVADRTAAYFAAADR